MELSDEMRLLQRKWQSQNGWPKRLEWIEVDRIRGWTKKARVPFNFPIVAIVGENGSGKSTLIQAAACVYREEEAREWFPTEFFPQTAWDHVENVEIGFQYLQGGSHDTGRVRKPTTRWLGQPDRPVRRVEYLDLSRLQPVGTRVGYARIAKNKHEEASARSFTEAQLKRLSNIMGRIYDMAKMAITSIDKEREVPVLSKLNQAYSGFHQGCGETTIAELLKAELPKYGLLLIDEIESSLHPRAQRRLMSDLAEQCRTRECQIILTTHSPYILGELPLEARIYILESGNEKEIITGVSPQFAMTKMDDRQHAECELYVEDRAAETLLREVLSWHFKEVFPRCATIPYGAANLGMALGQMAQNNRFPRPTCIFLDGDNDAAVGCILLPGGDSPERVVFNKLRKENWGDLWIRIGRDISLVSDACEQAMALSDAHGWVTFAANQLRCGGDILWHSMCAEWASKSRKSELQYIEDAIVVALH